MYRYYIDNDNGIYVLLATSSQLTLSLSSSLSLPSQLRESVRKDLVLVAFLLRPQVSECVFYLFHLLHSATFLEAYSSHQTLNIKLNRNNYFILFDCLSLN